ncbi:ketoacyl-synthetase C-terminal extension domain-containing protein [Streptomyces mexicanus]
MRPRLRQNQHRPPRRRSRHHRPHQSHPRPHPPPTPPTLNHTQPNPRIDFPTTPFYINTHLQPWPTPTDHPRRAAVSSFGIGGTNAHVILEQTPPTPHTPTTTPRPIQILPLSARTPTALTTLAHHLADHLEHHHTPSPTPPTPSKPDATTTPTATP